MATSAESSEDEDEASNGDEAGVENDGAENDFSREDTADDRERDDDLRDEERAVLDEIESRGDDAEVICIVRSRDDPDAKSEIIVLDRASPEFVERLSSRGRTIDVPKDSRKPAAKPKRR